ncbi:hypothetical protein TWF706_006555 [Orbilia oligospora]|nr:hypothetical protein TWF706_006555 [Orbilia oligospora]
MIYRSNTGIQGNRIKRDAQVKELLHDSLSIKHSNLNPPSSLTNYLLTIGYPNSFTPSYISHFLCHSAQQLQMSRPIQKLRYHLQIQMGVWYQEETSTRRRSIQRDYTANRVWHMYPSQLDAL